MSLANRLKELGFEVPDCHKFTCIWCGKNMVRNPEYEETRWCSVGCEIRDRDADMEHMIILEQHEQALLDEMEWEDDGGK